MLSWKDTDHLIRAYVRRNLYRLRPDMTEDDVVQECYFQYVKCQEVVTCESVAERQGRDPSDISDRALKAYQAGYMRKCAKTLVWTTSRSAQRQGATVLKFLGGQTDVGSSGGRDDQGRFEWSSDSPQEMEEVEVRLAFERLSHLAQEAFLSDKAWVWATGSPSRDKTNENGARIVARALGSRTRGLGEAVWDEIRTVMDLSI